MKIRFAYYVPNPDGSAGAAVTLTLGDDDANVPPRTSPDYISGFRPSGRIQAQANALPEAEGMEHFDRRNLVTALTWQTDRTHASTEVARVFSLTHVLQACRRGTLTITASPNVRFDDCVIESCDCLLQEGRTTIHQYRVLAGRPVIGVPTLAL